MQSDKNSLEIDTFQEAITSIIFLQNLCKRVVHM